MPSESFELLKQQVSDQKYRDVRTSHLIPASEIIADIEKGGTTSEIMTALQALSLQHMTDCWKAAGVEVGEHSRPKQPPVWVEQFIRINNGYLLP